MGPARRHRAGPHIYEIAGFAFETDESISGLKACRSRPVARFSISQPRPREWLAGTCWHHRANLPDGRAWPAFGAGDSTYVLDFEGVSVYAISRSGDSIEAVPEPGAPVDAVQRLYIAVADSKVFNNKLH